MRPLASFALTATPCAQHSTDEIHRAASTAIHEWIDAKGQWLDHENQLLLKFSDGRTAKLDTQRSAQNRTGLIDTWTLTEPVDGGYFETEIQLAKTADEVAVVVKQRAGNPNTVLAPFRCEVASPRFIAQIVGNGIAWRCGATRVRAVPTPCLGTKGGDDLVARLRDPGRNLPIVVVSEHEGFLLCPDLDVMLAREMSGLALVIRIDRDASLRLTRELGAEWSCYNGAIRLYWPNLTALGSPFAHPLWLGDRLLDATNGDARAAGKRIRQTLRRQIIDLSTSAVAEPSVFALVRAEERQQADTTATLADVQQQNESLRRENDNLSALVCRHEDTIRKLEWRLSQLTAGATPSTVDEDAELAAESTAPPSTVMEAVERAMARHGDVLVFGSDVLKKGVRGLSPDAGPPSKVLAHLNALADVARRQANGGSLGMRADQWLRHNYNVISSSEHSELQFDDGSGTRRGFKLHTKPNMNTDPGNCVRIYYLYDEVAGRMRIGWVGRHP